MNTLGSATGHRLAVLQNRFSTGRLLRLALLVALIVTPHAAHSQRARERIKSVGQAIARASEAREAKRTTERFDPIFKKYSKRYFGVGTDWHWFKAQGMAESDLTPGATSRVGARGIMQLMPSTYGQIRTALPHFGAIDNPEWNIAAGILHDRDLWTLWSRDVDEPERWHFVFAGYNAGEGTIMRARRAAFAAKLDDRTWPNIESVAPKVERWRYTETLDYVRKIKANHAALSP
ncbi:MAG: transglycosylase SLT domain-containing protein [Gemmatimonadota bacterium]